MHLSEVLHIILCNYGAERKLTEIKKLVDLDDMWTTKYYSLTSENVAAKQKLKSHSREASIYMHFIQQIDLFHIGNISNF